MRCKPKAHCKAHGNEPKDNILHELQVLGLKNDGFGFGLSNDDLGFETNGFGIERRLR